MLLYNVGKAVADMLLRLVSQALPTMHQDAVEQIFDAQSPYHPTQPVNIEMFPAQVKQRFSEVVPLPAYCVYHLRHVHVTWNGAVFHNLRVFTPSIVQARFVRMYQDTLLLRQWMGKIIHSPATACIAVCHDQWSVENYYHWLIDTLPRLLVLRQINQEATLLLPVSPKGQPDYIQHTVTALGFTRYLLLRNQQVLNAKNLLLPELTAPSLTQNPQLVQQVRSKLLDTLKLVPVTATRRVYAARASSGVRSIQNERAVEALLQRLGFEKVYFEQLSFLEQVQLMHETIVLVGVHGAGMTNMMFLPREAQVVELLNEKCGDLCYFRLASCLEIAYFYVPCLGVQPELGNQADLVVDTALLEKVLANCKLNMVTN